MMCVGPYLSPRTGRYFATSLTNCRSLSIREAYIYSKEAWRNSMTKSRIMCCNLVISLAFTQSANVDLICQW